MTAREIAAAYVFMALLWLALSTWTLFVEDDYSLRDWLVWLVIALVVVFWPIGMVYGTIRSVARGWRSLTSRWTGRGAS